jgi:hypothetical protein
MFCGSDDETFGSIKGGDILTNRITIAFSIIALLHGLDYKAIFCKANDAILHHI